MSWSVAAPEGSKRVGIGAIASDGTLAVVTLSGNKLTVSKVGAAGLTADGTTDDLKDAGKFVVGTFSKGKPASIIVPGKIIYRKDGKLTVRDTTDITNITGYVKFTDGTENVFYYEGAAPEVFAIDPTADKPVTGGKEMVPPDQGGGVYADLTIHPPVELLGALGIPEEAQKSGVMGIFDPRGESKVYPWLIWAGKDGKTVIAVAEGNIGGGAELKPIWTSQPVEGKVLDAAFGKDPKNPKVSGMLLLTASSA